MDATPEASSSFFSLSAKDAKGEEVPFSTLEGKVVLVVNVASECGFTGQYKGLEALNQKYKEQGLVILGFPCNQFGGQEPGTSEEVVNFCTKKFSASFPIMEKVEVNGDNVHPVYAWLKAGRKQLFMERIKWNFEKFLVRRDGSVEARYSSAASTDSLDPIIAKLLA